MKELEQKRKEYKISNGLNEFQQELQIHLVNWKWKYITKEPGINKRKNKETNETVIYENDAALPDSVKEKFPIIYPPVLSSFLSHQKNFHFRIHKHFHHMASSQAANANLFLPVLLSNYSETILQSVKTDLKRIARDKLDQGFQIEYGEGNYLNDKTPTAGTDSDIAIAYYNHQDQLCLWLIEHKLTEHEFTECNGFKSKGKTSKHDCSKKFSELLENKDACYYHSAKHYAYWTLTDKFQNFFVNSGGYSSCPFKGGMYQLWRNQLLALSIEDDKSQLYKHVYFSVVKHPRNTALDKTLNDYESLINHSDKFFSFTSDTLIDAAEAVNADGLSHWVEWYRELYDIKSENLK